ncbi:MAG: apolipoprotein N-acyltransferase [Akkermansiaceae bacterium]
MKVFHRVLLVSLSALLVIFSFEPFAIRFVALFAWVPFLLAIRNTRFRVAFRLGSLHGMLVFGATLSWTWNIFSTIAPALWFILSLFPALFAALNTRIPKKWQPVILATTWTGFEFFRGELFWLHFPWITPGTAVPPCFFTPIVGVYGVSFLIILAGALLLQNSKAQRIVAITLLATIWLIPNSSFHAPPVSTLKVGLIQNESMNYDDYRIASKNLEAPVDVIVWPEYAIGFDPKRFPTTQQEIGNLLGGNTKLLVAGGKTWFDKHGDSFANTAFTFDHHQILGTHTKNRLVHFFAEGKKGTEAKAIKTPLGRIGTPICFDCDHQDVMRRMMADGAEVFLIPSMDAKHWTARQHLQHAQLFRHRAAENARHLAIASTSGLTQIIHANGSTTNTIPQMEEGSLIGTVGLSDRETPFQKGGWLVGPSTVIATTIIMIGVLLSFLQKRRVNAKV